MARAIGERGVERDDGVTQSARVTSNRPFANELIVELDRWA